MKQREEKKFSSSMMKKFFALCIGNIFHNLFHARAEKHFMQLMQAFFRLKITFSEIKKYRERAIDDRLIDWSSKYYFEFPNYEARQTRKQWNFFVMTRLLIILFFPCALLPAIASLLYWDCKCNHTVVKYTIDELMHC